MRRKLELAHDLRFYRSTAFGGNFAAAQAYLDGYWSTDDLLSVMRLLARNRSALEGVDGGLSYVTWPVREATVKTHARRGLNRLRQMLGAERVSSTLDPQP